MSPQIMKDFRGWIRTALRCGALVALGFVFLALAAPRARAASPCCEITKIDLATGVATAKVIATGQSFQFKVSDVALLHSLKVGQGVFANFKTQKVSVDGGGPCCEIVNLDKVGSAGNTAAARNLGNAVNPVSPCCQITSIDEAAGVVTAKVNSTGQTFQFKVADAALLHSLKVGQGILANLKTRQVSINNGQPCCDITNAGKAGGVGNTAAARNLGNAVNPADPCCDITSIDAATGTVTAKVNGTGQTFQFKVADAALLHPLKVGQGVFANFKTQKVSVDGVQPCCTIMSLDKVGGAGNTAAARNLGNAVNPGQPCCAITSIDAATGTVTAKVNGTGQTFQFKVSDVALLHSLKVGQGIFANLKTRQVSINNAQPCCTIMSLGKVGGAGNTAAARNLGNAVNPGQPCCSITSIDEAAGLVTAKVSSTGAAFQFTVKDSALLQSLKVGQSVYANFKTHQVSVDGIQPCCGVISTGAEKPIGKAGGIKAQGPTALQPASGEPCCEITSIDAATGVVTAKMISSDQSFKFAVKGAGLLNSLKVGQSVYANFKTHQVSVDGVQPCCDVISTGATPIAAANGATVSSQGVSKPGLPVPTKANMRTIDPCTMASATQLQQYASANIAAAFPITYNHNGESVNIHEPQLSNLTCAPLHIEVSAAIHYRKTRGIPQGSASGHLRFGSPVVARIVSTAAPNAPIASANFQSAQLCLTDITVNELNLNNVPNWIDNTWIRNYLNQQFGGTQRCSDVSLLVALYLQNGGSIP